MEYRQRSIGRRKKIMLIGELSKKTGLSRDTIRFYEKLGLIAKGKASNPYNNYKTYSEATLARINQIMELKGLGFTLLEIQELLAMLDESALGCLSMTQKMGEKMDRIDLHITQLQAIRSALIGGLNRCATECPPIAPTDSCAILDSSR